MTPGARSLKTPASRHFVTVFCDNFKDSSKRVTINRQKGDEIVKFNSR